MRLNPRIHPLPLLGAVVLASGALASAADYQSKVLSLGPTHYWRLNDKPTIPAADVAKNSGSLGALADGYYVGAASHPASGALAGNSDTGVGLDATAGTAVSVPYSTQLNPGGAFTVEGWFNPNADTTTANPTCAISSGQFASPRSGWLIYQVDNGWAFRMYNQNGTATSLNVVGGTTPVVGTWYHVVAVYDGTNGIVYVNSVANTPTAPTGYVPSAGGPLFIGGRADSSFWWNGTADEVALYDRALTAAEIDSHYKNGIAATPSTPYNQLIATAKPVAYYRLNEGAYSPPATLPVAKNLGSAGAAGDGSYNPGVNGSAAGPRPPIYSAFEADNNSGGFNGNAGFVGTPATLNDLPKFTIMGWIKRGAGHSGRGGYFGQNDLLEFGDADSGANVEAWINAYNTNLKIGFPFKDDEWGQIALVADGAGATLYTNGVAATSITQAVDSYGSNAFLFNIGGGGVFNASGDYFNGNIDEVAVFAKALTATEIQELYYAANIAPTITGQPTAPNRDLFEGNAAVLGVAASGTPPLKYQWRKGGNPLLGKTSAELNIPSLALSDAGSYDVVVSNDYGTVTSQAVTLAVKPADTVAPVLQYAAGTSSFTSVKVWFSEPLDQASAETAANYQISDGLTVSSAKLSAPPGTPGDNIVILTTAAQTAGKTYTLTVNGVKDQGSPANSVAAGSTATFASWVFVPGYLAFEHYDNLSGAADTDITKALADPRVVAGTPTTGGFITTRFDTRVIFPDDSHENFLSRITGEIVPKESGNYYFFLRSDDAGRLYLSTDETIPDPTKATVIAIETGCCGAFAEPDAGDAATTATPIALVAGKRYGVLALLKEAGGGDYLQIAWRKDTDSTPATELPYLPAEFFGVYVDPNADITFTTQPVNTPATLPTPVVDFVTVDFTKTDGGFTVENTEKVPPGPWAYTSGTGWSADGGESACSGPYNSRLISPDYTIPLDEEITVTFSHRYSFEGDYWDGGQVQFKVNTGTFGSVSPDNFTANGYLPGKIQGSGEINGQRAFNGDSAGYAAGSFITTSATVGAFKKNDKLAIRFLGAWDDCTTASVPGWVVQNMKLAYGKAPRAVVLTAAAVAKRQGQTTSISYQWQRDDGTGFVNIPDATSASYRFFPVAADLKAKFRVLAGFPGKFVPSNEVTLTDGSVVAPEITIARTGATTTVTYTGRLQSAPSVAGPYTDVAGATTPYAVPSTSDTVFFRSAK